MISVFGLCFGTNCNALSHLWTQDWKIATRVHRGPLNTPFPFIMAQQQEQLRARAHTHTYPSAACDNGHSDCQTTHRESGQPGPGEKDDLIKCQCDTEGCTWGGWHILGMAGIVFLLSDSNNHKDGNNTRARWAENFSADAFQKQDNQKDREGYLTGNTSPTWYPVLGVSHYK